MPHLYPHASFKPSPHADARPDPDDISLLVIHNISLPPGQFGQSYISDFFLGHLDAHAHPYFATIASLRVSAHLLITRQGEVLQFVPFEQRAWHAGVSSFQGRQRCNDFSIGIELEGTDLLPYTTAQYTALSSVTRYLMRCYQAITLGRIVGHCDIAPGRKNDPGMAFDWAQYRCALSLTSAR